MMKQLLAFTLVLALGLTFAVAVQATHNGAHSTQEIPDAPVKTASDLIVLLETVADWIFAIFIVIAVVMIVLAAFQFVTAGGNATAVGEARMKILWAAIGILVALGAQAIPQVVANIIGAPAPQEF